MQETEEFETLVASLDVLVVRPTDGYLTKLFLYYLFGTKRFINHTSEYATGTTVLHLSKLALPKFCFPMPKSQLVKAFDSIVCSMQNMIMVDQVESARLKAVRDILLPKLVSGLVSTTNMKRYFEAVDSPKEIDSSK